MKVEIRIIVNSGQDLLKISIVRWKKFIVESFKHVLQGHGDNTIIFVKRVFPK